jgi:hypothetical protein
VVKEQKEQVSGRPVGTRGLPAVVVVMWVHEGMELGKARGMGMVVHGVHKARVKGEWGGMKWTLFTMVHVSMSHRRAGEAMQGS